MRAVADLPGHELRVVAPVPYFPPIRWFPRWYAWSQFPRREEVAGLEVHRPRYFLPPKIGHRRQARLMFAAIQRTVERLAKEFDFDLIDAHFVYPNGTAAVRLGELTGKPVVITGRGEDMCRFPAVPGLAEQIRETVAKTTRCIAVSREIADAFITCGADPAKVDVIGNGVDCQRFRPIDQVRARRTLGLPESAKIVVSVGDRFENKGFHLLVEALVRVRRHEPDAMVVIVGGSPRYGTDYTQEIERLIRANGLQERVILAGRRSHDELPTWYNAADVFALLSGREGSPNVLTEALACGLPTVATDVGGVRDILKDDRLGVLLPERSAEAAAEGILAALHRDWDKAAIRRVMEQRDWSETARAVGAVFEQALGSVTA